MARKRHVIRTEADPRGRWVSAGLVVAALLGGAIGIYYFAQSQVQCDWEMTQALERQQRDMQASLRALRDENQELAEELVRTERGSQIDDAATTELQATMEGQQAEIAELKEQLAFYRGIVSPEESATGVRPQRLAVWRAKEPRVYHFSLILIQSVRNESKVDGRVQISIHGVQEGGSKQLDISSLLIKPRPSMGFRFRYFQEIDGAFRLPRGFDPGKVDVRLTRSDKDDVAASQSFDWQTILQNSGA